MAKIHLIEKCKLCGRSIKPITPNNLDGLYALKNEIKEAIERPSRNMDDSVSVITNYAIADDKADITYFFCNICCRALLRVALTHSITCYKRILFQKFDGIKEKLQNV